MNESTPLLLRALAGESVERTPIWLYRQAGRYLPEYRELRSRCDFRTLCNDSELAAEATLQPIRRYPLDASIVFSDLLVPFEGMGLELSYGDGGPQVGNPPRSPADWQRLAAFEANDVTRAPARTLEILARELPPHVARIGFSGGPWTLAAYLVQGRGSKDFIAARSALLEHETEFRALLDRLADAVAQYLADQVRGGAQVVQIFDTWAGLLSPPMYRRAVLPSAQRLCARLREHVGADVPIVWFARGPLDLVQVVAECGVEGCAVDFTVDLAHAVNSLPHRCAVQGNLDPAWLLGPPQDAAQAAREVAETLLARDRAVFNLGHGITPQARPETVAAVIESARAVTRSTSRSAP